MNIDGILKNQLQDLLSKALKDKIIKSNYSVRKSKLPRKLKKKYKKERKYCFEVEYTRDDIFEITIPINESESK